MGFEGDSDLSVFISTVPQGLWLLSKPIGKECKGQGVCSIEGLWLEHTGTYTACLHRQRY